MLGLYSPYNSAENGYPLLDGAVAGTKLTPVASCLSH